MGVKLALVAAALFVATEIPANAGDGDMRFCGTLESGGKQVEAELLSADKARRIYEDIVRKARDPALLEYADRDVFKVRFLPEFEASYARLWEALAPEIRRGEAA